MEIGISFTSILVNINTELIIDVQFVYRNMATGLLTDIIQVSSSHAESVISE
jgi:hypothetical protein